MTAPGTAVVRNPWLALCTLLIGSFVMNVSTTSVNTAIPEMSSDLHATFDQLLWVSTIYTLTLAVLVITGGRLGDLYGQKKLYLGGLTIYTVGSVACGLAPSATFLVFARVVQAVGSAMVSPQALSMISRVFPPERRGAAIGLWGTIAGGAVAIGPTIGGAMVTSFGWRGIFLINVPVGLGALVLGAIVIPNLDGGRRHRLDLLGSGVASIGLLLVTYGFIEGPKYHWGSVLGFVSIPMLVAAGFLAFVGFFFVERSRQGREPLLPFAIMRNRNFSLMSAVNITLFGGVGAVLLLMSIYLQTVLGMTALQAGLVMAVGPVISMGVAPVAGRLVDRLGGKLILVVGTVLFAAGLLYVAAVARVDSRWTDLLPGLALVGVAMGATFAPPNTIAMHDIDKSMAGAASGTINTIRTFGGVIGSALVGAILQARLAASLAAEAHSAAGGLPADLRGTLLTGVAKATAHGLQVSDSPFDIDLPGGLSASASAALRAAAQHAYGAGLTDAMRVTILLPAGMLLLSMVLTLLVTDTGAPKPARAKARPDLRTSAAK